MKRRLLETTPCDGLDTEKIIHFRRLIGETIASSLDHDYPNGRAMLAHAASYILARSQERSRFWYLSASMATAIPFMFAGALLWLGRGAIRPILGETVFWLCISAAAGATGAILSVIARKGNLQFDASSGRSLHYLEATSRILAGVFSGLLA